MFFDRINWWDQGWTGDARFPSVSETNLDLANRIYIRLIEWKKRTFLQACYAFQSNSNSWWKPSLKLVMVLIPLYTSLVLFCWSLHSSLLLYLSLASLIFTFSSLWIICNTSLLPALKAQYFVLRMSFMSFVTYSLLFGWQRKRKGKIDTTLGRYSWQVPPDVPWNSSGLAQRSWRRY